MTTHVVFVVKSRENGWMEFNISDAEWVVMEVVWKLRQATAADVISELAESKDWNHRTIRTLLSRLTDKGALEAEAHGNRYVYRAKIGRAQCVRSESRSFLVRVFGGDIGSLLMHFAKDPRVSREDLEQLRDLLDEQQDRH